MWEWLNRFVQAAEPWTSVAVNTGAILGFVSFAISRLQRFKVPVEAQITRATVVGAGVAIAVLSIVLSIYLIEHRVAAPTFHRLPNGELQQTNPDGSIVVVDENVLAFSVISPKRVFVLGTDRKLWLEYGPFTGKVPPPRVKVDESVGTFTACSEREVMVTGHTDQNVWDEFGPYNGPFLDGQFPTRNPTTIEVCPSDGSGPG